MASVKKKYSIADKKPLKPETVQKIILGVFIFIALLFAAGIAYFLYQKDIVKTKKDNLYSFSRSHVNAISQDIATAIYTQQLQIANFSIDKKLAQALQNNSSLAIQAFTLRANRDIKNLEAIRFFELNKAKKDIQSTPPIRFTELQMIRAVEKNENPPPEAIKIDNKWLLAYATAVKSSPTSPIIGSLITWTDIKDIKELATEKNQEKGKLELLQSFEKSKKKTLIFNIGKNDFAQGFESKIENTPFYVQFKPMESIVNYGLIKLTSFFIAVGSSTFILLCLSWLASNFINKKIKQEIPKHKIQRKRIKNNTTDGLGESYSTVNTADILEIDIREEDENILGLEDDEADDNQKSNIENIKEPADPTLVALAPDNIFRAYDIRGLAQKEITKVLAEKIGQAIGSEALDNKETTMAVARDARTHSPELFEYLIRGILSTGCNIINLGTIPTPLMYFATETLEETNSGVIVTASHNTKEYNGFKCVIQNKSRSDKDIKAIRERILRKNIHQGKGEEKTLDIIPLYIDSIFSDVALAGDIKIVLDAGNAVPGKVAPQLFEALGCQVETLFCDLDGEFPNHSPDPSIDSNLTTLVERVKEVQADLGVAFDGDGDRLVAVTSSGKIITPDRLLMVFAKDIVSRNPGADVVFDVKCTRHINQCVSEQGGRPIMWRTGHSPMKEKMRETGALLGGEFSGHVYIRDRWFGFDDGMYAAARLIEIISLQDESLDSIIEEFDVSPCTPELKIPIDDQIKFDIIEKLQKDGDFDDAQITNLDGLRADFKYGWGLVRASNTSAALSLRFEADTDEQLHQLKALFIRELRKIDSSINANWQ